MYIAPSSSHEMMNLHLTFRLILRRLRLFSDVWSENAALPERLMEINSNPLYYTMALSFKIDLQIAFGVLAMLQK